MPINTKEGGIASAEPVMLSGEFSARDQPFCDSGPDHASDDELGALGLRARDIRSSRKGWATSVGGRRTASEVGTKRRDGRANLAATMKDRSQIPMRYPICSAVTTAIAINAIDQTLSVRAIPAAIVPTRARLITGTRMRTLYP